MGPEAKAFCYSGSALRGLLLLGGVLALVVACGGNMEKGGKGRPEAARPAGADSLEVSLALDSGSYAIDEIIKMRLVVVNKTDHQLTLAFPTAQRFDFVVRRGGKVIWQWSADMMFAQVLGRETIAPGDSLAFTAEWNQRPGDGTNPGLGAYTLQGIVKTAPEIAIPERPFGIVD